MCKFFVVLGNGQALLGMHDIDALNIINININTINIEYGRGTDNWCTNKATPLKYKHDLGNRQSQEMQYKHTQIAFQNLILQISQWSIINYLIQ